MTSKQQHSNNNDKTIMAQQQLSNINNNAALTRYQQHINGSYPMRTIRHQQLDNYNTTSTQFKCQQLYEIIE